MPDHLYVHLSWVFFNYTFNLWATDPATFAWSALLCLLFLLLANQLWFLEDRGSRSTWLLFLAIFLLFWESFRRAYRRLLFRYFLRHSNICFPRLLRIASFFVSRHCLLAVMLIEHLQHTEEVALVLLTYRQILIEFSLLGRISLLLLVFVTDSCCIYAVILLEWWKRGCDRTLLCEVHNFGDSGTVLPFASLSHTQRVFWYIFLWKLLT